MVKLFLTDFKICHTFVSHSQVLLVLHFHVLRCHVMPVVPSFLRLAFSCPVSSNVPFSANPALGTIVGPPSGCRAAAAVVVAGGCREEV